MNPTAPSQHPGSNQSTPAADYVLLMWEYDQGEQSSTWTLRYGEFCHALASWNDVDRTDFWYDLALLVNRDPRLEPTPGLLLTPELFALEVRRMHKLVDAVAAEVRAAGGDPHSEDCKDPEWCSDPDCEPQGWLRFTDPILWSFNGADLDRYLSALTAHLRDD